MRVFFFLLLITTEPPERGVQSFRGLPLPVHMVASVNPNPLEKFDGRVETPEIMTRDIDRAMAFCYGKGLF